MTNKPKFKFVEHYKTNDKAKLHKKIDKAVSKIANTTKEKRVKC